MILPCRWEEKKEKDISLRYKVHQPCKIFIWEFDELTIQWRQDFYQRIKKREKVGNSLFVPCDLKQNGLRNVCFQRHSVAHTQHLSIINRYTEKTTSWLLCVEPVKLSVLIARLKVRRVCFNASSTLEILTNAVVFFNRLLFRGPEWAPSWVGERNLSSWQEFRSRRSCHRVCGRYSRIIYGSSCSSFNAYTSK